MTFVFTKCDKMKGGKAKRPDENIRDFQELMRQTYRNILHGSGQTVPPVWAEMSFFCICHSYGTTGITRILVKYLQIYPLLEMVFDYGEMIEEHEMSVTNFYC
ncbi:P-loop containing nucleoside triphosphate hydrolases superfamily protein [Actinidia rufa]|uniref:P-loop containing nucleoside triphosphate hydrolases superfamily protein n=1 Tax=Actinidia rufa TaxID=165716 RepID=A0A7J0E3P9_9ERIC|nr:P-loop containing nucleoside triphosphate hydrolases superfamily protein [Actinidia rufa]